MLQFDEIRFEPIYTDTYMCDPDLRQEIEQCIEDIKMLRDGIYPPLPHDWELVLELGKDEKTDEPICSYYFVCHSTRCLFWLQEFDPKSALNGPPGVTDDTHIREPATVPDTHRTKRMIRPGVTSPVLVRSRHIAAVTS